MKKLTPLLARQIAEDIAPQISFKDFFLVHSEKVGQMANLIAEVLDISNEVFEIAGRVHDIGYAKDFEKHADYAIPLLEELGYQCDDILKDCIIHHWWSTIPDSIEWKIFQLADKLSIFDLQTIKVVLKEDWIPIKSDNIIFLQNMANKACKLLTAWK